MSSFRWSPSGQDTEVEWIAFQSCLWCWWLSPAYVDILSFQRLKGWNWRTGLLRVVAWRFLFNLKEQKPILPPTSSLIPPLSNPSSTVDSRKRKRTFVTNLRDQSKSKPPSCSPERVVVYLQRCAMRKRKKELAFVRYHPIPTWQTSSHDRLSGFNRIWTYEVLSQLSTPDTICRPWLDESYNLHCWQSVVPPYFD